MGRIKDLYHTGLEAGFSDHEITSNPAVSRLLFDAARHRNECDALKNELDRLRMRHAAEVADLSSKLVAARAQLVSAAIDQNELESVRDELAESRRAHGELEIENAVLCERLLRRDQNN